MQGWGWYKYIPKALDVPEAFIINRKTAKKKGKNEWGCLVGKFLLVQLKDGGTATVYRIYLYLLF